MSTSLKLRVMTRADLPFADAVRSQAGWNQTPADWERFVAMEPGGCFVAEWEGRPAGTATTIVYGPELAWIGMVLVHADFRRRGIGSALLERCIGSLHERGVRCVKLDATPLGKMVYDRLGFKTEWTLTRWERPAALPRHAASGKGIRKLRETDLRLIEPVDTAAFGTPRIRLLRALAADGTGVVAAGTGGGKLEGYALSRPGRHARYLGPCSASGTEAGIRLMHSLVAKSTCARMFWDIPDANEAAIEWARRNGFTQQRTLIRMSLGDNAAPGDPRKQFAIAAPEVG